MSDEKRKKVVNFAKHVESVSKAPNNSFGIAFSNGEVVADICQYLIVSTMYNPKLTKVGDSAMAVECDDMNFGIITANVFTTSAMIARMVQDKEFRAGLVAFLHFASSGRLTPEQIRNYFNLSPDAGELFNFGGYYGY